MRWFQGFALEMLLSSICWKDFGVFRFVCNFANWQDNLKIVDAYDLYEK
jgi:hypothetical protein